MVGTAPLLMASTYASVNAASMGPVMMLLFMRLGCALLKMSLISSSTPWNTRHYSVSTEAQHPLHLTQLMAQ